MRRALSKHPRIHVAAALAPGASLPLPLTAAHHLSRVLRARVGDAVVVFNEGIEFTATIARIDKHGVTVKLVAGAAVAHNWPTRAVAVGRSWLISHSQMRTTVQPASSARAVDRRSRSRFLASFACHRSAFGPVKVFRPWRSQPCQKQPSTNTANRYFGSTKSGVQPLASWR